MTVGAKALLPYRRGHVEEQREIRLKPALHPLFQHTKTRQADATAPSLVCEGRIRETVAYDNFTLASANTITEVQWIGSYFNPPQLAPITAWTVTFYSNNGGQPGAAIQSFNVAGNDTETFLQNDNVGDPNLEVISVIDSSAVTHVHYRVIH